MNTSQAKKLAYELTIKYIEINRNVLNNPSLSKFANINKQFYDAIIQNETLSNLY